MSIHYICTKIGDIEINTDNNKILFPNGLLFYFTDVYIAKIYIADKLNIFNIKDPFVWNTIGQILKFDDFIFLRKKIHWRIGSKVGRTIYADDVLVGMMDTPELAKQVVDALNKD